MSRKIGENWIETKNKKKRSKYIKKKNRKFRREGAKKDDYNDDDFDINEEWGRRHEDWSSTTPTQTQTFFSKNCLVK